MYCTFMDLAFDFSCVHIGEECELTCRESNNEVVILPSNMTAESVLKEHWRNPLKVEVRWSCLAVLTDALDKVLRSTALL